MLRPLLLLALSLSNGLAVAALPAFATDNALSDQVDGLFKQRQYAEAQAMLEKVTAAEPKNAEAHFLLGRTRLYRGDHENAVVAFEKATTFAPTNSEYFRLLGDSYGVSAQKSGIFSKFGWAKKCKAAYDKAVELDPANINARWSVMEYCRQAPGIAGGGMDGAYAQAEAIKKLDARRGRIAFASLYTADQKYPEAFALFDEALRENPADTDALYHLGRIAAISGQQLDRGLAALRECTKQDGGNNARTHNRIGNILEKQGDLPGAKAAYESAVALDPKFTPAVEALRKLGAG